jgi:hypothetical protein
MLQIAIVVWLTMGILGYMMMRQGFLVNFEREGHGKSKAWRSFDMYIGFFSVLLGPIFIIISLGTVGKKAFQKRPNKGTE